jgi:hypothetical protein
MDNREMTAASLHFYWYLFTEKKVQSEKVHTIDTLPLDLCLDYRYFWSHTTRAATCFAKICWCYAMGSIS